jgi:serpin B
VALLLAWEIMAVLPERAAPFTASPEVSTVVKGNTAFALDLYQKLREPPGNLFFSPYSLSLALAMADAGARGPTGQEMAGTLHLGLPQTNLPAAFMVLAARMNRVQRWNRITLLTANSMGCQQAYEFADPFLQILRTSYDGEAHRVDFIPSAPVATRQMNDWVERRTKGNIKGVVGRDQFTPDTGLVLCNAVYFKGKWPNPFQPRLTEPMAFHVSTNQTVVVPMMSQESRFKVSDNEAGTVELLELPYSGNDLSMIILLPVAKERNGTTSLADLEHDLTVENLRGWLEKLDQAGLHETPVALPRFTARQRFDLAKVLAALGMPSAFRADADFSGMETTGNLYFSSVIHQAFIKVDETGSEAAAVTYLVCENSIPEDQFIADDPFIFLIREKGSGTILFLGRMVNPTQ